MPQETGTRPSERWRLTDTGCSWPVDSSGWPNGWRDRPLSARGIRHAHLTEAIRSIHADSRGTYGARRVRAELALGRGVHVGHGQLELLMRRAGRHGLPGRKRWRHAKPETYAADLVKRDFPRSRANALWVTDIERHEALLNPAVVKGHRWRPVAAGRLKLRTA